MMLPLAAALCADDDQGGPDILFVSDSSAIDPEGDLAPYEGARVQSGTANLNSTGNTTTLTVDSLILEPTPPTRAAYDTDGNGTNDSDFQLNGGAIVVDLNEFGRGTACGTIEAVNITTSRITIRTVSDVLSNSGTPGNERLAVVPAHEYRIVNGDQLQRNGRVLAEGVEDLQLAYFLDANADNVTDPGEWHGSGSGANANFDAQGIDMSELREVRLNLAVRTRGQDRDFAGAPRPLENHPAAGSDGHRRRAQTMTVRLRNMTRGLGS
jgi:hypothetical protein